MDVENLFDCFDDDAPAPARSTNVIDAPGSRKRPVEDAVTSSAKEPRDRLSALPSLKNYQEGASAAPAAAAAAGPAPLDDEEESGNRLQSNTAVPVRDGERSCMHDIAFPPGVTGNIGEIVSKMKPNVPPARTYPFKLDPFQNQSTLCIDKGESVLVSAHTSAGKTVIAEYVKFCQLFLADDATDMQSQHL